MIDEFEWSDLDPEDIVVEQTQETAVYWSSKGDLVLRQRGLIGDEDEVVLIPHHRVQSLIDRMQVLLRSRAPQ